MKKITNLIIEEGTQDLNITKERTTLRGITLNEKNEVLLVYSFKLNDYTFPGGGTKPDEDHLSALRRELKEELGALSISNIKPFGYIQEKRFGIKGTNSVYLQTSYYYFCQIDEFGPQTLVEREIEFGVEPIWISIDQAIDHNQALVDQTVAHKGMKTVLPREIAVLKHLKEYLKNETF